MGDSPNDRKCEVKGGVRGKIGGGAQSSFDDFTMHVGDHQIFRLHLFVRHAAGLDDDQTIVARHAASVAKGRKDQPFAHQVQIGFKHLFAQFLQPLHLSTLRLKI